MLPMLLFRPILALLAIPSLVAAQATCFPDEDDNEAKLLAFYSAPIAFSPSGNVTPLEPGKLRLAFDVTYVPEPDASISRSDRCFGDKAEETQLSPFFPRPRVVLGLRGGFAVEASYLPPVTLMDATPNLGSIAVSRLTSVGAAGLLFRLHATVGKVDGAITCPEDALQMTDLTKPCFGSEKSQDTYKPNMFGAEAAVTFPAGPRATGYAGAGYTSLRPRFQVGFQEGSGAFDNTKIAVDLNRIALFGGAALKVSATIALTAELYSVPEDVTTVRVGATWR
ncbi:MAG: hypothetical protein ACT4R6_04130 [Gemmatimonadaceae bacterium]